MTDPAELEAHVDAGFAEMRAVFAEVRTTLVRVAQGMERIVTLLAARDA